jgi:hypothetical protein
MRTDEPTKLRDEPKIQLSVWVPHQLSARLDELLKIANSKSAGRLHRKDLVAAFLFAAPEKASDILRLLDEYANATPEAASVGADKGAKVYAFRQTKPGPRPSN